MNKIKTRFWLFLLTIGAFIAPLGAVIAIEHAKNSAKIAKEQQDFLASQTITDEARAAYYQNIAQKKNELQQTMAQAKTQYEALLKNQPATIAAHQKTVTQTTTQPVVVKKIVKPTSSSSSPTSANQPTSTRKTKTS